MDRVGARIDRRREGDVAWHGHEDGGIFGQDEMTVDTITVIRGNGASIGIELLLKDEESGVGRFANNGHQCHMGKTGKEGEGGVFGHGQCEGEGGRGKVGERTALALLMNLCSKVKR